MAIAPPPSVPAADRVPDAMAGGTPPALRDALERLLGPGRVLHRVSDLVRYASDSSPYRLIPQVVVMAHDAGDVAKVLAYGREHAIPVTFRAAGTSLNGQAQSDGILVDVRRHFRGAEVLEDGAAVRARPGTLLGFCNRLLARHDRRMGPDPASTDIATVGGVVANNSGGMRCGTTADSYSTMRSMTFVLPSGTVIDTAAPDAEAQFAAAEPQLAAGLLAIRDELRADTELAERIRRKFEIKNTTGYRLCAFLDADEPLEIFRRLIVGSEGTLAFIAEAVMETVPHGRHLSNALVFFTDIDAASAPVPGLVAAGASAVELMVNPTLIAASWTLPGVPEDWREIPGDGAVLLIELRTDDPAELDGLEAAALAALEGASLVEGRPAAFTRDAAEIGVFWHVREGMQGIVGGLREPGSAMIIEDVCVPPQRIAESARDIQGLLGKHGFLTGVAGHASAGNLHFLLTPNMVDPADLERYEAFMGELVPLVVDKYDGSLKAEHGTGRNMAPYVEQEWGAKATEMMWRVKQLADPDGVLNPGSVLSRDPQIHLAHLKSAPPIEEAGRAHLCIECGFCESACPSRDLTTTPRQRIVLRREMARQPEGSPVRAALVEQYGYDAVETCAADGSCVLACPLGIDTGKLVKSLRATEHSTRDDDAAVRVATRWGTVEKAARTGLRAPGGLARAGSDLGRRVLGEDRVPAYVDGMPGPSGPLPQTVREGAAAVYLPACINRIFGPPGGRPPVPRSLVAVSARAGKPVWIPQDVEGHCCSTPWTSKGYSRGAAAAGARMHDALWRWSDGGQLPVVVDATSCTLGLLRELDLDETRAGRHGQLRILDASQWALEELLPALEVRNRVARAVVHPTCATRHLGLQATMESLAAALADEVVVPPSAVCCGQAGDRGFLHPELPESSLAAEAAEVRAAGGDAHLCGNRTCEIALGRVTGEPFDSAITWLDELTR